MPSVKLRITASFFLAYFSFFAVSQIAYNVKEGKAFLLLSNEKACTPVQFGFSQAIDVSVMSEGEGGSGLDDGKDLILLRKKRAVLSANKIIKNMPELVIAVLERQIISQACIELLSPLELHDFKTRRAFSKYRSGLSPPLA